MLQKTDPIEALPFVRMKRARRKGAEAGRDFWHVKPTGDHDADFENGCRYARMALAAMNADADGFPIVSWAIQAMATKGKFGAIEQGFLRELSELARRDLQEIETPLLRAEGTLSAAEMLCNDVHFNRPGREYHAMRELVQSAADHVQAAREALFPGETPGQPRRRVHTERRVLAPM
jgi:hypothetical protein